VSAVSNQKQCWGQKVPVCVYQAVDISVLLCDSLFFAFLTIKRQCIIHCCWPLAVSDFPVELDFEKIEMWGVKSGFL